jgi:energy-converting hydrogenase B subunit D
MSFDIALDLFLMLSCLVLAWMSIFSVSLFRCIVFFVCLGLLVTIAWGQMGAYDVAIAEAAIGAGITGAIFLAAWNRIRPLTKEVDPSSVDVESCHQEDK